MAGQRVTAKVQENQTREPQRQSSSSHLRTADASSSLLTQRRGPWYPEYNDENEWRPGAERLALQRELVEGKLSTRGIITSERPAIAPPVSLTRRLRVKIL